MYINQVREKFTKQKDIIISTDAKKRELVGNFKNNGVIWCKVSAPKKSGELQNR